LPGFDVLDAEIGGQVDNPDTGGQQPGTCCMAMPLGVAKKTRSQAANAFSSGTVKARSVWPRRLGKRSATGRLASDLEVITCSSTSG